MLRRNKLLAMLYKACPTQIWTSDLLHEARTLIIGGDGATPFEGWGRGGNPRRLNSRATLQGLDQL